MARILFFRPPAALLALGLLSVSAAAQAQGDSRLYMWVDESGTVHYSDSIPPEEARARRNREVKSSSGQTVDVIEAPPTREELEARRREAERRAAVERALEDARQRDRNLLLTFSSVQELRRARDNRVEMIDAQVRLLEKRIEALEQSLEKAREQAARMERTGQGDPEPVYEEISKLEQRIERNRASIEEREAERARVREEFARDIQRYRELAGN